MRKSRKALLSLAEAMEQGKTALAERETPMEPQTLGPEGYAIWGDDELSASGVFVRAKLRAKRMTNSVPAKP